LLFLEYALPLHPYHTLGIQQRPQEQQLEQLNDIRRRYMVTSSQTALAELLSLRDSGRAIARTEPPYSSIISRNALRFLFLTNHHLAFSPHISPIETHCVSRTALMKLENLKHETRRVSVG
jgi:hypothetical protein